MESLLVLVPLAAAMVSFLAPGRGIASWGFLTSLAVPALAAGTAMDVYQHGARRISLGGWAEPLGIHLHMDGLSVIFLLMTALVGALISIYSAFFFTRDKARHFWPLWLIMWAGLNSLFMVSDVFNAYVVLELVTICAVALAVLSGKTESLQAGLRYLLVAMAGSLAFLMGVGFLYAETGMLDMFMQSRELQGGPAAAAAFGLMTTGLIIKSALLPFHFWLPPAHGEAPAPVSALLSALVIKGSFFLLLRLWVGVFEPAGLTVHSAYVLGCLGVMAVLWGSYQALIQARLKLIIAYSSVAQVGYLFLMFPLLCTVPEAPWAEKAWAGGTYQAISHGLAKAALFLAAGNLILSTGTDRIHYMKNIASRLPMTTFTLGLAGVSLMGLPPSGGFVAKWMFMQAILESGQWWWAIAPVLGGLLTAGYVFRILGHAFLLAEKEPRMLPVPFVLEKIPLLLALCSILIGFRAEEVIFMLQEHMLWTVEREGGP